MQLMTRFAAATVLLGAASLAQAQWMWVDAKGIKQFSDQPPPPSIPLRDILKAPKGQQSAANMPAETAPAAPASAPAPAAGAAASPTPAKKGPPTLAEREADYAKRQKEQAEKDKKAGEESAQRAAKAENCERAAAAKRSVDSGARIATTGADGERSYMDDSQRAAERQKIDKVLAACAAR